MNWKRFLAKGNASINMTGHADAEDENDDNNEFPQSEAAVRRSVLSVAAGDRLAEAIELADQELKDRSSNPKRDVTTNPLLLNMEPPEYMLWVLRTIKSAELEQSLLLLPMSHMERLVYYMILLLRKGMGVELCAKVAVFLVRIHQNQVSSFSCSCLRLLAMRTHFSFYLSESLIGSLCGLKNLIIRAESSKVSNLRSSSMTNEEFAFFIT